MKATFIGVPGESHDTLTMYGQQFPLGQAVHLESPDARRKLAKHQHFKVEMEASDDVKDAEIKREFTGAVSAAPAPVKAAHVAAGLCANGQQTGNPVPTSAAALAKQGDSETAKGKPSEGLSVQQLRDALKKKGVTVPATVKLKDDLAAMLDAAE